jgi:F-type H+-transporting ATPase subunit epsilon
MADHDSFEAQVLTPEGEVFSGELVQVTTRTTAGEVGILARHIPMVARLVPAELRLYRSDNDVDTYAQGEGWLEVFANRVRVLIAEARQPEELDAADLRSRLEDAEQRLKEADEGSAAAEQAERQRARCEAFIQIAEKG